VLVFYILEIKVRFYSFSTFTFFYNPIVSAKTANIDEKTIHKIRISNVGVLSIPIIEATIAVPTNPPLY
jgi:hypothetical protein